jgi:hypothetical protein
MHTLWLLWAAVLQADAEEGNEEPTEEARRDHPHDDGDGQDCDCDELDWEREPSLTYSGSHGFRLGYSYVNPPTDGTRPVLQDPHVFVMGYELSQRVGGDGPIDVLFIENVMLSGLNQSVFAPSANFLLGFDIGGHVELGVGPNLTPMGSNKALHMIAAIGFTPSVGLFDVPLHVSYIPDIDGAYRLALTTGVSW